jgi:hypothetical protein
MAAVKRSIASDGDVSEQIYQEIAADEDVIDALELWMVDGKEPDSETNRKLLSYMGRMPAIPADSYLTFYRGQPVGVRPHKRGWASWTTSRDTTRNFIGRNGEVLERKGVQGVSLEQIALWRTRLTGELHDYGSQGEWIVLNDSAFGASPSTIDIRRSANGAIQGFFDPQTGQSFLIADNLTAEAAPGVLMHEVGIHMAADGSMKALFNRAAMMLKLQRGNPFMKAVQARMDAAGETSGEEAAAYIAEAYENDRANAPASVQRWLADLLAAVKAWMFKKGIMGADRLTVADIAAVARANARSMARDGGATGGQGAGAQSLERAMLAFARAYHGTPHRGIEKFSTDKIGTGEGAQAYGWGLYFASKREIADHYRRKLSGDGAVLDGIPMSRMPWYYANLVDDIRNGKDFYQSKAVAISIAQELLQRAQRDLAAGKRWASQAKVAEAEGNVAALQRMTEDSYEEHENLGQLYEVEIPEDSEMLLWDRPLSEQPEKARKALESRNLLSSRMTGEQLYKHLKANPSHFDGLLSGSALTQAHIYPDQGASMFLSALGIKGIKYLDGDSRNAGEGSYNYVIFNGDDVQIERAHFSRTPGDQTQTENFRRWFGDSKAVDAEGKPLVRRNQGAHKADV